MSHVAGRRVARRRAEDRVAKRVDRALGSPAGRESVDEHQASLGRAFQPKRPPRLAARQRGETGGRGRLLARRRGAHGRHHLLQLCTRHRLQGASASVFCPVALGTELIASQQHDAANITPPGVHGHCVGTQGRGCAPAAELVVAAGGSLHDVEGRHLRSCQAGRGASRADGGRGNGRGRAVPEGLLDAPCHLLRHGRGAGRQEPNLELAKLGWRDGSPRRSGRPLGPPPGLTLRGRHGGDQNRGSVEPLLAAQGELADGGRFARGSERAARPCGHLSRLKGEPKRVLDKVGRGGDCCGAHAQRGVSPKQCVRIVNALGNRLVPQAAPPVGNRHVRLDQKVQDRRDCLLGVASLVNGKRGRILPEQLAEDRVDVRGIAVGVAHVGHGPQQLRQQIRLAGRDAALRRYSGRLVRKVVGIRRAGVADKLLQRLQAGAQLVAVEQRLE
mmetsp:Transcript_12617/g.48426  ORF Transcript_12617/g.48426 Transcript_12617/m.48426 type:complete len:445 (+) Transcript_12617:1520-2854(+)